MYGYSCYGSVPHGGLIDYDETSFPLAVFMNESSIYGLVLALQDEYTLSLSEA